MEEILLYYSLKYNGDFEKIFNALSRKEKVDEKLRSELKSDLKCQYVTFLSDNYPKKLKEINCLPFVLYYYGNLDLLNSDLIAITGTTSPDEYGIKMTKQFTKDLVKSNQIIVGGLAKGVDIIAHSTALENNGSTIAVLPCGIEKCYPKENEKLYNEIKENHLLISEYPFATEPNQQLIPFRNRLISGLSDKVLITQCQEDSVRAIVTAGYAIEQGKDVYCVPGEIDTEFQGCNRLIQQGAYSVLSIEGIVEDIEDDMEME